MTLITVVALAVRLAVLAWFYAHSPSPPTGYLKFGYEVGRVARAVAAGEGFSSPLSVDTGPTAWFTPIYPLLLAGVFKLFGVYSVQSLYAIKIINDISSALACIPIFYIGRRVFGATVGAWSAWLWSFLPTAVIFPNEWVWDTSLSALLMALIFWATVELRSSTRLRLWVGYGALWALTGLTNPSLLSLLPFFLGWLGYHADRQGARWARLVGASALVFIVGVSPWLVRNYLAFGKFVPFRSDFGLELYLGNNPDVPDSWSWWLHPNDNDQERTKFQQMGEPAYMAEKQHEAVQFIMTHPRDFARFAFHRFINNWTGTWDPIEDVWSHAPWYLRGNYLVSCLFSVLAMLGVLFALRTGRPEGLPFAIVLLVFPLVYYVSHTALRYRFPIDPVMTVLAISAVVCPISAIAEKFRPRADAAAGPPAESEELTIAR